MNNEELIAPCGMNCALCSSYQSQKHALKKQGMPMPCCTGCRPRSKQCAFLKKRCRLIGSGEMNYCYECRDFPCENLLKLDKRYQTLYRMSMVANLKDIRDRGIEAFLSQEQQKWQCARCGGTICCHNGLCFHCDFEALRQKKKVFRWED